jgi:hypothetical protein
MPRDVIRLAVRCIREALDAGHSRIQQEDITNATFDFSNERRDYLCSQYVHQYPGLNLVLRQFSRGPKHFDIEYVREVAFKTADFMSRAPEVPNMEWALSGVDDPLALGRSLLRTGFVMLKEGRSDRPRIPDEEDIVMLTDSQWYAIHPMYETGLGLDGSGCGGKP